MDIQGLQVVVLGLGATGLSCARWLAAHGAAVWVADTRAAPPALDRLRAELPDVPVRLGSLNTAGLAAAELIVLSPGLPRELPELATARAAGVDVIGDVELFARVRGDAAPVLAVTGSNGKTTVTALTGALCAAAGLNPCVAGNIGPPVLDALLEIERARRSAPGAWVLELSSYQLETLDSLPMAAATLLNLSEDHLDRYAGMADYAAAKARVYRRAAVQVVNRDDPGSAALAPDGPPRVSFGLNPPPGPLDWGVLEYHGEPWLARGDLPFLRAAELRLAGRHNWANALAATALAVAVGVAPRVAAGALAGFEGLPHRVQKIAERAGVAYYDDSKGTNVGATLAALEGLRPAGRVLLIAGGDGKGQDFRPLAPAVAARARAVFLIGRDAPLVEAALGGSGVPVARCASLPAAVADAARAARRGDAVLLSPACASFDMFRDYEHRARVFADAVLGLGAAA